ncbi:putative NmrA-like domain-containing protein [Seiridium cardinale]|uniref:NmrA-like domain-containing protein n=1 Tax=Seiridium cardinale TaxID=138064 RepID=A0ABR2X9S4_9PEZI
MPSIEKVAVFGAAGNFGAPITSALIAAGFHVTVISRPESTSNFPSEVAVIRVDYTVGDLTEALIGQDAAVCVVGPAGIASHVAMIDAAEAAGLKRFIINDFGWGPNFRSEPEFREIGARRHVAWDHAKKLAQGNPRFTWTGITIGNPIDWALRRFSRMGFDVKQQSANIYDEGTEQFTGTTLEGIGQAVVGVFRNLDATANRFVRVRSIQVCQNQLLEAFQQATEGEWNIRQGTTKELFESGKRKYQAGAGGWVLDLLVFQLFEPGKSRCIVASRESSDAELLGVREESPAEVVAKVLK